MNSIADYILLKYLFYRNSDFVGNKCYNLFYRSIYRTRNHTLIIIMVIFYTVCRKNLHRFTFEYFSQDIIYITFHHSLNVGLNFVEHFSRGS